MYRILDDHAEVRERRDQLRHPVYAKPELLVEAPNQVWSWDITTACCTDIVKINQWVKMRVSTWGKTPGNDLSIVSSHSRIGLNLKS
jgi:hypothetical protein